MSAFLLIFFVSPLSLSCPYFSGKVFFDVMSGLEMGAKSAGAGAGLTPTVSKLIDSAR